jgi:hypothetical protein
MVPGVFLLLASALNAVLVDGSRNLSSHRSRTVAFRIVARSDRLI